MATTLTLRKCRPGDIERIAQLARDEVERGLAWTWKPVRVARALSLKDTLSVAGVLGGQVVGFCIASYGMEEMHVTLLAVAPEARRLGIASALLDWHVTCARVAGISAIDLELRATNPSALAFYENRGFEAQRRIPKYYQGREDAIRMRLDIRRRD